MKGAFKRQPAGIERRPLTNAPGQTRPPPPSPSSPSPVSAATSCTSLRGGLPPSEKSILVPPFPSILRFTYICDSHSVALN